MKVIIFGATGKTGQQLIERSLSIGYRTSVFVHNHPQRLSAYQNKITTFGGDVLDFEAVDKAISGQDAVVVALGIIPGKKRRVLSLGTANIIRSMTARSVDRLVVETGAGLIDDRSQLPLLWRLVSNIPPMRAMFDDKRDQEKYIKRSRLDWVIVRPANLTNGPSTSSYTVAEQLTLRTSSTISRADVAAFMIDQVTSSKWLRKAPILVGSSR